MDERFGWAWLRAPYFLRMTCRLTPRQCMARFIDEVHCDSFAPSQDEVIGAVSGDEATLQRRHQRSAFSRSVDASARVEVAVSEAGEGSNVDCTCFIGGPTLLYMSMPFLMGAVATGVILVQSGFQVTDPYMWLPLSALGLYGVFFASSMKSQAAEDVQRILDFVTLVIGGEGA